MIPVAVAATGPAAGLGVAAAGALWTGSVIRTVECVAMVIGEVDEEECE